MNKILLSIMSVIFMCACSSGGFSQADLQEILDAEWQAYSAGKTNFGGGLAMQIISPRGDYFISTGMGEGMSRSHRFRAASVTKTFTAAGIMLLEQRGKLDIEHYITDNIPGTTSSYVPDAAEYDIPNKGRITIRMLLMHRAGVFDLTNQDIVENDASRSEPYVNGNYIEYTLAGDGGHQFTFDELFGVISRDDQVGFDGAPDSQYRYSDTGYSLLALILERVSGKSYVDFIRDEFLTPNCLDDTTLPWEGTDKTLPDPFVSGYMWMNDELSDVTLSNMSAFVGNGNIITTPLDLATWCQRLFHGEAGLTSETVAAMMDGLPSIGTSTYGLGIEHMESVGYGHGGAQEGYLTEMRYKPDSDVCYVLMSNVWDCESCPASLSSLGTELSTIVGISKKVLAKMGY
ncbi:MAG: beta-lactamase family protein [Proteobacteria bacterium]|nr:beta-lactamase family protein [Pseudomonadota bacterium]